MKMTCETCRVYRTCLERKLNDYKGIDGMVCWKPKETEEFPEEKEFSCRICGTEFTSEDALEGDDVLCPRHREGYYEDAKKGGE